jgi:hypothetical protein
MKSPGNEFLRAGLYGQPVKVGQPFPADGSLAYSAKLGEQASPERLTYPEMSLTSCSIANKTEKIQFGRQRSLTPTVPAISIDFVMHGETLARATVHGERTDQANCVKRIRPVELKLRVGRLLSVESISLEGLHGTTRAVSLRISA